MANYASLLIGAGGGVIDRRKQSERQPGATVIIGLGGTGSDAVVRLKKEIHKQLRADDVDTAIPVYSDIRYLVIDSDESWIKSDSKVSDIDKNTEYFSIANKDIKAVFAAKEVLRGRHELDWLNYERISIDEAAHGAGGIRQVGRFLLVDRAERLYTKIKSTIQGALTGSEGRLTIHICAGISGGTGSGTFLDICYLVRQALKEMAQTDANICGYFFLPDVNLSVPAVSADPLKAGYVSVNGFAALKELDYCMNFQKNKDSFRMHYGFKQIDDAQRPVDLCYLVSSSNAEGRIIENGYQYAMGVVTDFIINFMAKVTLPEGVEADTEGLTLAGHISNLYTIRGGIRLQHGANVEYNILGAAVAEMPLSEIATYLGSQLFERYADMYDRTPTEKERNDFLQINSLQYEDMRKALAEGCQSQIRFPKRLDAKRFKESGEGPFEEYADSEYLAKNRGRLEANSKALLEGIRDFHIPKDTVSLISRTYKALCEQFLLKLEYGPFYAHRMLCGSQNKNVLHALDGFITENLRNLDAETMRTQSRVMEYKDALDRMRRANFLNEKSRLADYLGALNRLYVNRYRIEMLQSINDIMQGYQEQILALNANLFTVLTRMLDTLQKTFAENSRILTEGVLTKNAGWEVYTWKILSVPDIKKTLDEEVKKLDLQQTLYVLMRTMLDNCVKWLNEDENQINRLVSDFILHTFEEATRKTITDYLRVKFGVDTTVLLVQRIEDEVIREKLSGKSVPMFWKNPMYRSESMRTVLTVPYDAAEIKEAAALYAEKESGCIVRQSGITDKISMMRFYSGLPMYAYQGILELQEKYESDNTPGRHLFECGDVNWNVWLPSPVPESFKIGMPLARIAKRNQTLLAEFEAAQQEGIVQQDVSGNWNIMVTEAVNVDAFLTEAGGYETNGKTDINKLNTILDKLEAEVDRLRKHARPEMIACMKAKDGSERQVMLDFYLAAPVLNRKLQKEREKYGYMRQAIEKLKSVRTECMEKNTLQKDFFTAIFTGVLYYGNIIAYRYDEFGVEKTVVLQDNEMPYGDTGAYQAFLTFCDLDNATRKKIVNTARERMNRENVPEVKEAVEKLDANMAKRIARYMMLYDETNPLHTVLENFYREFMKSLQAFRLAME